MLDAFADLSSAGLGLVEGAFEGVFAFVQAVVNTINGVFA